MFNLIVGTGALTMPRAFATAGWVVSLALISLLGFMRYVLVYLKTENACRVHRKCLNLFFMFSLVCLSKCPCCMRQRWCLQTSVQILHFRLCFTGKISLLIQEIYQILAVYAWSENYSLISVNTWDNREQSVFIKLLNISWALQQKRQEKALTHNICCWIPDRQSWKQLNLLVLDQGSGCVTLWINQLLWCLVVLSFTLLCPPNSYMTTTFMIEAMAAANAQLRWKRREQEEVR